MERTVRILKNGKVVAEIPESMFPLEVKADLTNQDKVWSERSYTWKLSYHKDEGYKKIIDLPRGMQLE